jgi:cytochrome c oxidase subunit 2
MPLGVILILVALTGCALFVFRPAWFPVAITAEALAWDHQFNRTLWITGVIFLSVQTLLAWAILRVKKKPDAPLRFGHRGLEIGWTLTTLTLFLTLAALGSSGWARVAVRVPARETLEVYSHQFAWNFRYPGPDGRFGRTANAFINDSGGNPFGIDPADPTGKDDIVTASLRIPAGRDVLLLLHSRDVIHDFFVRELRTKQDIVPGMEIPLDVHVEYPGEYEIACAELCGLGHSQMRSVMIVMPPAAYDQWKHTH